MATVVRHRYSIEIRDTETGGSLVMADIGMTDEQLRLLLEFVAGACRLDKPAPGSSNTGYH